MNNQSIGAADFPGEPLEETRRGQLIEVTIDSLAELGYVGTTLAQIAGRAGVSTGLVAHYFGDKDGLLDAAFRSLARRVSDHVRAQLHWISTPRARIQAIIDANLAPEEFDQRTGTAWLAFWGQVLQVRSLREVQFSVSAPHADQPQELAAASGCRRDQAEKPRRHDRSDDRWGVVRCAALSGWREADSASARGLLTEFVDRRLQEAQVEPAQSATEASARTPAAARARAAAVGERFATINPASGEILGYVSAAGQPEVDAVACAAARGQAEWGAMMQRRSRAHLAPGGAALACERAIRISPSSSRAIPR